MSENGQLEQLEQAEIDESDLLVSLAWLTITEVPIDLDELRAARRRAILVFASGGDPHRDLSLDTVAVARFAEELDTPERREALDAALASFDTTGLPTVAAAVETLRSDPELAWRLFALAHVADELVED